MNHEQLGEFVKDHLLPRLTDLEEEVRLLREVCWPVCQALREKSQLDEIKDKRNFLKWLKDDDEIKKLLIMKADLTRKKPEFSTASLLHEEFAAISSTRSLKEN